VVLLLAIDLVWVSRPIFVYAFPIESLSVEGGPFHQVFSSPFRWKMRLAEGREWRLPTRPKLMLYTLTSDLAGVRANLGTLDTYTGQLFPVHALPDEGDTLGLEQVRAVDGRTPRLVYWSPNELRIEIDPGRGGQLVVNQNFERGWSASGDGEPLEVGPHGGAPRRRVGAGRSRGGVPLPLARRAHRGRRECGLARAADPGLAGRTPS
jgi:hypothetical protein